MKKRIIIILIVFFMSCKSVKNVFFSSMTYNSKGKVEKFNIKIPRDYIKSYSLKRESIIKKWLYNDGIYIYISSDITFKDSPNVENWMKCSNLEKKIKCLEGFQDNGRCWKEVEVDDLVIGYINVPKERKEEFDKAILSFGNFPN